MANHTVVISGIGGSFPECENIKVLQDKIFTNDNFVTEADAKWKMGSLNIPAFSGKMKDPYLFDQLFFGIHRKLCIVMDTHARQSMERTYEALCDAGLNPHNLDGSNVAVLMSSMTSETEYGSVMVSKNSGHAMLGHSRSMQANRISYFFNFKGPSFSVDCSWVGPMQALEVAADYVAKGYVKMAVVGASSMLVYPEVSVHYESLKKLNPEGKTKSFSADAEGYNRSEGVVVFVVQRAEDALRSYGSIVKVKCTTEMSHSAVFADAVGFNHFITDFYSGVPVKNSEIAYIEGDGSASLNLDALELNGISDVLCSGRDKPLLVGSCKSRFGHGESCAAFLSIVNSLIAFKTGYIPPCLHFSAPNPLVPALLDGRMKVVTEKTPLEGDYIGVTTIGLASIFAHVLLKKNPKSRPVKDASYFPPDNIPRLFLLSGRNESVMMEILKKVEAQPIDENYYALNHSLFKSRFPNHLFRGYSVVGEDNNSSKVIPFPGGSQSRPIWYIFSGMGSQWNEMGTGLMKVPIIRQAIEKCHNILLPKGLDLISIITSVDPSVYDNILHAFVGIAAIQVGLVDLLDSLGVIPDGIVGHSVGELGCSYADKCLTAEQVILAAYARGKASNDAKLIKGMMAAVGKGYAQIKDELPEGIEVACHNSKTSCTLSGPAEIMEKYVEELKSKGVFARLVNVSNIAYHSKNIKPAAPFLLNSLREIIPEPNLRSAKWISSSVPESQWDTDLAKYCSAEYHTNNLLSYVLFEEATAHVPKDAICIEIAPHGLLQAIVKKSLPTCSHVSLTNRAKKEGCFFLIEALGNMFTSGVQINLANLYPKVEFPVPRETDYLNVITWDHSEVWVPLALQYDVVTKFTTSCWKELILESNVENKVNFHLNHRIRGNTYYPKSKFLGYMMDYLKEHAESTSTKYKSYEFQDIKFHGDVPFTLTEDTHLQILFQTGTGAFEILHNSNTMTTGNLTHSFKSLPAPFLDETFVEKQEKKTFVNGDQIYDYFETNDCLFNGPFRNILSVTIFESGFSGKVKWRQSLEHYLDALFKLLSFYSSVQNDCLMDLASIFQFFFDAAELPENDEDIDIYYDKNVGLLVTKGVRIHLYTTKPITHEMTDSLDLKTRLFLPYSTVDNKIEFTELCIQIFKENCNSDKLYYQYILDESSENCKYIAQKFNVKDYLKNHKIFLRPRNSVTDMSMETVSDDHYLIIAENGFHNNIEKLIKNNIPFYFIYTGSQADLTKKFSNKELTLIIEQKINGQSVTLYKQRKAILESCIFKEVSCDDLSSNEIATMNGLGQDEASYLVIRYRMLTDVISIMRSSFNTFRTNKRFIFIDDSSPRFDPKIDFYKEQLAKDLMINIAFKGTWGSLRDKNIHQNNIIASDNFNHERALNYISCKTVDLKVIGLNLQSLVFPKNYNKLSIIEFAGTIGDEQVFGLGKLTQDNYLEVDPHFCWIKPKEWTMEEAVTVPFYYCVAYDIIYLRTSYTHRPHHSLLIHAGHTPFGQVVINVAHSVNILVYTTCYTQQQKKFICKKYPQIKEENIYVIGENRNSFLDGILSASAGDGPKLVIDTLESNELRNHSLQCTGDMGVYYLMTNNEMDVGHSIGLNIFLREISATGYNPELIFDLKEEIKMKLNGVIANGIKNNVVKPLERYSISGAVFNNQAADTVVMKSEEEFPKKVVLPVTKQQKRETASDVSKEIMNKKNYMIVGTHNNLWFDLLKWLVSKGADSIHVVLNQEDVPQYLKKRFSNFITKHKYISVLFSGTETLNTAQNCTQFIKGFQNGSTIDTVFYLKSGFEKQMANIDYALRMNSKTSCLVSIGLQACRITEKRRNDGFRGVSFILMKSSLRNCMVLNALDNWFQKCDENDDVILVDKAKPKEITRPDTNKNIFPSTGYELLDLQRNISEKPGFIEIPTKCGTRTYARDLNTIFLFPGLKLSQLERFSAQLMYPTYMAQYPAVIKSLNDIAVPFSEMMISMFDYRMFTLIAEGWAGPLVLTIAKLLEEVGKITEVILLDGAPESVKRWNSQDDSVISKCIPTVKKGKKISVSDLRNWSTNMSELITREDGGDLVQDEIQKGLDTLINRLDVVQQYSCEGQSLMSTVHLFTEYSANADFLDLQQMCANSFNHHVMLPSPIFLENPYLIENVNNLPLVEYKMRAKKQVVKDIATLQLLGENMATIYNSAGFAVTAIGMERTT